MNFDLDDDQREFAAAARDFYQGTTAPGRSREMLEDGADGQPGLEALCRIGFYGITVPEEHGGAGRGVLDLAVVAEQAGRVLAAPSLVTAARAAVLLQGHPERLASLADGSTSYAVLDGGPSIDADHAEVFLALYGDALVCGPGTVTAGRPIDPTRGLATANLTDPEQLLDDAAERWARATRIGQVVLAAEDLGTAARAVEIGVAYALDRTAFGRQIGSYQAVKHALVDAYVGVEQLRSLVWWAAWAADQAPEELPLAAAAAKAAAGSVLEQATETLIQVHGGIGFTWEHDAHLFWRRAKVDRLLLGDETSALDEVAHLVLQSAANAALGG